MIGKYQLKWIRLYLSINRGRWDNKMKLDEKGNVLVIVLLLVTMTLMSITVFMKMSIVNTDTLNRTERENVAVEIAEMGVDYYKWIYNNEYELGKTAVWDRKYREYENGKSNIYSNEDMSLYEKEQEVSYLLRKKQEELYTETLGKFRGLDTTEPIFEEDYLFKQRNKGVVNSSTLFNGVTNIVTVKGKSDGIYEGKEKSINYEFKFTLPDLGNYVTPDEKSKMKPEIRVKY